MIGAVGYALISLEASTASASRRTSGMLPSCSEPSENPASISLHRRAAVANLCSGAICANRALLPYAFPLVPILCCSSGGL